MTASLPDFLIIGANRSGTSLLWHLLNRHPDIRVASPLVPEAKFFARAALYAKGLDWYRQSWFPARTHPCEGEKSTAYMDEPAAAARIAADLPQVKLIALLREPGLRAWSNWKLSCRTGLETLDFASAIAAEAERTAALSGDMAEIRPFSYLARSRYADILQHYRVHFPPERVFVGRYEDLIAEPGAFLARVHEFLGVAPRPQDGLNAPRVNEAPGDPPLPETLDFIRAACADSTAQIADWFGPGITLSP